jgi:phosphoribosylamine--glycine ligase
LAWKLASSTRVDHVYVAPGNAGTAGETNVTNVDIGAEDIDALIEFARSSSIALTVVGPEAPLVAGIVDRFSGAGLRCFGPTRSAAQLEGSKRFTKDFLRKHAIPTAGYESFDNLKLAEAYIDSVELPVVVKADGHAAGKGVISAHSKEEALAAARSMLSDNAFGSAGSCIVVEDFLVGEEASFICVVDGETVVPLASSQDHKARDDGDVGPNTGGMGAYSPAPVVTRAVHDHVMADIIEPTVRGLASDGIEYKGILYAGLMIDSAGRAKVLEYNCRGGDPETQPILMRLNSDLVDLIDACIDGTLSNIQIAWDPKCALGVVMAAGGYPDSYVKGDVISGLGESMSLTKVFHAGTANDDEDIVTNGGRVLCVCGLGHTVAQAQATAYARVAEISWNDAFYRHDIGHHAVARERQQP